MCNNVGKFFRCTKSPKEEKQHQRVEHTEQLQQQEQEPEQQLQFELHYPELSNRQQLVAFSNLSAISQSLALPPSLPLPCGIISLRELNNPNCNCNCYLNEAVEESSDDQILKEAVEEL